MIVTAALEKNGEWVAIKPNTRQLQFPKWHKSLARLAAMKVATHHEVPYGSISLRQSSKHIVGISWWVAFKVKRMRELTMNGSDWRLIWSMMEWVFCHWWGLAGSLSSWEGKGLWVWLACGVKMGDLLSLLLFWKWGEKCEGWWICCYWKENRRHWQHNGIQLIITRGQTQDLISSHSGQK